MIYGGVSEKIPYQKGLSNRNDVEQTDFTGGWQEGAIGANTTKTIQFDLYVAQIGAGLANGYFRAYCDIVNADVKFKKQGVLDRTQLTDEQPR